VGVILVHQTEMASYPWEVVRNSNSGEKSYLKLDGAPKLKVASWVQLEVAKQLASTGGMNIDKMMADARSREFHPVTLPVRLKARSRIRSGIAVIQSIGVARARFETVDDGAKVSRRIALHRHRFRSRTSFRRERKFDALPRGRPHHELPTSIRGAGRPQGRRANGLRVAQAIEVMPLRIPTLPMSMLSKPSQAALRLCQRDIAS